MVSLPPEGGIGVPRYSLSRLQLEFDQFVLRATQWILTAHKCVIINQCSTYPRSQAPSQLFVAYCRSLGTRLIPTWVCHLLSVVHCLLVQVSCYGNLSFFLPGLVPGSSSLTCRTAVSPLPPYGRSFGTSTAITPTPPSLLRQGVATMRRVVTMTAERAVVVSRGEQWS